MNIAELAFTRLFQKRKLPKISLVYGKLHGFNTKISLCFSNMKVHMSKKWQNVSEDIQIGCIQELLLKLYKVKNKKMTIEIELYNNFVRSLSDHMPQTKTHPVLEDSFRRVNSKFFNNDVEIPNLKLGKGVNLLGSYCYQTNTITISRMLLEHPDLMDYVMFHEMLHKKHKFYSTKTGRSMHHSYKFRKDEKSYPNSEILEKQLQSLINSTRRENKRKQSFFYRFFK